MPSNRTRVYLTVDVETSMGGAWRYPSRRPLSIDKSILCTLGDTSYGVPFIVNELNKYSFRATFFTEVFFSYCLGADQAQIVVDYLQANNQDVQLHIHPVFRNYSLFLKETTKDSFRRYARLSDALNEYDENTQSSLIFEGAELFRQLVGEPPVAFRAGGFRGDKNTLSALSRAGIPIDSSYNPGIRASFPRHRLTPNLVQFMNGTIEMPLTNALSGFPRFRGWKPMAISSVSFAELKTVLEQANAASLGDVVLILHSFSMVKPRDIFYSSFRPNQIVISRFRRLLKYLADQSGKFEVCTMRDASVRFRQVKQEQSLSALDLGYVKPLIRKAGQALDRVYWI